MLHVTPIAFVFVVHNDVSVRGSLESPVRREGRQPETFVSTQEFLDYPLLAKYFAGVVAS